MVERKGTSSEQPIYILDSDKDLINISIQNEFSSAAIPSEGVRFLEKITYSSFEQSDRYQMFYIFSDDPNYAPSSYASFKNANLVETTSDAPFFDLDLPVNTCIYMIFRSINRSGISNPGPVYKFINHNHGDGTYTYFDTYELYGDEPEHLITCEKIVEINPSNKHLRFNFGGIESEFPTNDVPAGGIGAITNETPGGSMRLLTDGGPTTEYDLALRERRMGQFDQGMQESSGFSISTNTEGLRMPEGDRPEGGLLALLDAEQDQRSGMLGDITLGDLSRDELPIWNRSFKFRFRSTTTGNAFDVNIAFDYSKLEINNDEQEEGYDFEACGLRDFASIGRREMNESRSDQVSSPDYEQGGARNPGAQYDPDDRSSPPGGGGGGGG